MVYLTRAAPAVPLGQRWGAELGHVSAGSVVSPREVASSESGTLCAGWNRGLRTTRCLCCWRRTPGRALPVRVVPWGRGSDVWRTVSVWLDRTLFARHLSVTDMAVESCVQADFVDVLFLFCFTMNVAANHDKRQSSVVCVDLWDCLYQCFISLEMVIVNMFFYEISIAPTRCFSIYLKFYFCVMATLFCVLSNNTPCPSLPAPNHKIKKSSKKAKIIYTSTSHYQNLFPIFSPLPLWIHTYAFVYYKIGITLYIQFCNLPMPFNNVQLIFFHLNNYTSMSSFKSFLYGIHFNAFTPVDG